VAARGVNPIVASGTSLRMARSRWQRALIIVSLIFAGEAIFTLPYRVASSSNQGIARLKVFSGV